jgi:glutamine synthetase
MADRFVFLRVLLKEIAKKYGYFVSFMPKTTISDWRSGAHINHSVASIKKKNKNIYKDGDKFSDKAYNAVAGILKHGAAITALACPTVNSYNGFVPTVEGLDGGMHTWAPTHMTYGNNNRSAMIRLPQNRFCIEDRASDLTQNPYLTFSLLAAAATEGIDKKMTPPKATNKSLYDLTEKEKKQVTSLPRNLLEAVDAFAADPLTKEVFSEAMINNFVGYKYDEWSRYHTTTTDWEIKEYLKLF